MKFHNAVTLLFIPLLIINLSGLNEFISKKLLFTALLSPLILTMVIVLLVLFLIYGNLTTLSTKQSRLFYWTFFIYLSFGVLASIFEGTISHMFNGLRYYIPSLLIFWVGMLCFPLLLERFGIEKIVKILRYILLLNTIVIILSYFSGGQLIDIGGGDGRFAGFLLNPNRAGFSGVVLLVCELYLLGNNSSKLSYYIIPMVLLGVYLTFSRTAFIMTFLVVGLFLVETAFARGVTLSRFSKLLSLGVICVIVYSLFMSDLIEESISQQSSRIEELNSFMEGKINPETTGGRSFLAEAGLERIFENPIFGNGLHTFAQFEHIGSGVHNQYLLIWGEAGIFALLAYLYYLVSLWRSIDRNAGLLNFLVKGLVICIIVFSSTSHNMFGEKTIMLILSFISGIIIYYSHVRYFRFSGS